MEIKPDHINLKRFISSLALTAVFNTIIAIFLTVLEFGEGFVLNLIFSQCIGLTICSFVLAAHKLFFTDNIAIRMIIFITAMTAGSAAGTLLGAAITGVTRSIFFEKNISFIHVVFIGILFGSIISYFFFSREKISQTQGQAKEEKIKRLSSEKRVLEANLKLLQAQIEPHFLFNTLSNILSLMDSDPDKGRSMLVDLIHYLRTSLSRSRGDLVTMAQEMEMVRAYLNIFKIRMGDRLHYTIQIPDRMKDHPFPPMLVQPLVENAIKHGLEPGIGGGEVLIRVEANGDILELEVADTGLGLLKKRELGIGLSNIKERLKSLYGDKGRLVLEENRPTGLKAIIEVPLDRDKGNHRR